MKKFRANRYRRLVILGVAVLWILETNPLMAGPQVYAGPCADSSFLVDGAGTMDGWGVNEDSLGLGGSTDQATPATIPFPVGVHAWRAVAAADGYYGAWTYAIGDDAQLYGAGWVWGVKINTLRQFLCPRVQAVGRL